MDLEAAAKQHEDHSSVKCRNEMKRIMRLRYVREIKQELIELSKEKNI